MKEISNIKKIGVLSDTHIPQRAKKLPSILFELFKDSDLIIHCGDITTQDVIIELNAIAPVYAVKGNMDSENINLPEELILKINEKYNFCIAHGNGDPFTLKQRMYKIFIDKNPHIIIFGHSHLSENSIYNNVIMFNPGSCIQALNGDSIGIINLMDNKITADIKKL